MEIKIRQFQAAESAAPPGGFGFDVRGIPDIDCAMRVGKKALMKSPKGVLRTGPKYGRKASEWKSLDRGHWMLMQHNGKTGEAFILTLGGISLQITGFASYRDSERAAEAIRRDTAG